MAERTIVLRIRRQDDQKSAAFWEEFELPFKPTHNVISMLMEIRNNPVNRAGKRTTPVTFEANCLEEVCGACTMVVNGRVRQACSALADRLPQIVTLEPMSKFPLIRDLMVDRSRMFQALLRAKAWVPIDGTYSLGPGPKLAAEVALEGYVYSRCMTCGCCLEACPQVNDHSSFMGPSVIGQVYLMGLHPTGAMHHDDHLEAMMGVGGISDCGNAQNCVQVCPKQIPLTTAIARVGGQVSRKWLRELFVK